MPSIILKVVMTLFFLTMIIGCGQTSPPGNSLDRPPVEGEVQPGTQQSEPENDKAIETAKEPDNQVDAGQGAEIKEGPYPPNEAGKVMVLMYHNIGYPDAEWTRTPENFHQDLERLYNQGYRLVSLLDYARGKIDLPKGYSPVILTFDDGSAGQFRLRSDDKGELVPDSTSAVGILLNFHLEHPDFGQAATFFTYYPIPFRQSEYVQLKYQMLVKWGMEIGNHTLNHQNLKELNDLEVQKALAGHQLATEKLLPGYQVQSLALPYGARPKNKDLLTGGKSDGVEYRNLAVLLVGANPAPSPYSSEFKPDAIPRIRASEPYFSQWLQYFEDHPNQRYVSDGDSNKITVPGKTD